MLTIQPKLYSYYQTSFKARNDEDIPMDIMDMDEDEYNDAVDTLEEQRDNFEDIADGHSEFKVPETVKPFIKGGAILTTGLLGGMAAGWGTKKSIVGFSKLAKTAPAKNLKTYFKDTYSFIKTTLKTTKKNFLESNVYKKPAEAISKNYKKFGTTQFGGPIVKFFNAVGRGIKNVYKAVKKAVGDLVDNLKAIKKEKYQSAAVNTVGVSGGVSSGVMALKEKQGDD